MYDVTVIGPSVIDILAAPFDPEALARGKRDMDQIRMSFGGDALNEAVVLTRLGKKVQLLSKIGADQAGRSIRKHLEKAIFCPYWTRQRTLSHSPAFLFLPALLSLKWKSFL